MKERKEEVNLPAKGIIPNKEYENNPVTR